MRKVCIIKRLRQNNSTRNRMLSCFLAVFQWQIFFQTNRLYLVERPYKISDINLVPLNALSLKIPITVSNSNDSLKKRDSLREQKNHFLLRSLLLKVSWLQFSWKRREFPWFYVDNLNDIKIIFKGRILLHKKARRILVLMSKKRIAYRIISKMSLKKNKIF